MVGSRIEIAAAFAALLLAGQAEAGNVPGKTPANVTVLPNIIYRVAYWVDTGDFQSYPSTNTTIVITPTGTGTCHFQVQWVGVGGETDGYTGGNPNYENLKTQVLTSLTTAEYGNFSYVPLPIVNGSLGVPFVYSNMTNPASYGSANIRTDCATGTKALVAAYLATYNSAPTAAGAGPNSLVSVPVTPVAGNSGD